ncbi:MAG: hypothetical protein B7Z24_04300 [Pseudomonadales bacterium 32-42-5]|nr:MAG: hypothetical protein B7Z24_04300 [Pseudomonadales bacterium 32-42-5]
MSTLGADQFDERYSADRKEKESFFNWYVLLVCNAMLILFFLLGDQRPHAFCKQFLSRPPHCSPFLLLPPPFRFYWSINLGALISYTLVAYICQYGAGPDLGGEKWGFFVGYTIPSIMMSKFLFCFYWRCMLYGLCLLLGKLFVLWRCVCLCLFFRQFCTTPSSTLDLYCNFFSYFFLFFHFSHCLFVHAVCLFKALYYFSFRGFTH